MKIVFIMFCFLFIWFINVIFFFSGPMKIYKDPQNHWINLGSKGANVIFGTGSTGSCIQWWCLCSVICLLNKGKWLLIFHAWSRFNSLMPWTSCFLFCVALLHVIFWSKNIILNSMFLGDTVKIKEACKTRNPNINVHSPSTVQLLNTCLALYYISNAWQTCAEEVPERTK